MSETSNQPTPTLTRRALLTTFPAALAATLPRPTRAADPAPVRVEVAFGALGPAIPADFLGLGYETSAVATSGLLSGRNTHYINLVRTLGPNGLIRIGGNISDYTQWSPTGEAVGRAEPETTVINKAGIADLADFLKATDWKVMWGLNLGSGSKEQAVAEAVAVSKAVGSRLHSFEIGNEVDLMGHRHPPGTWNYAAYHALYGEYKAAIRTALPDAVFSGPDCAGNVDWCRQFAETESADLRALTLHYYRGGAGGPTSTLDLLLQSDEGLARRARTMQDICQTKGLTYRINETNSFSGGGKPGVSDVFGAALWCLDYMFLLASYGCGGVNIETDINQHHWVSHYSPIFRDIVTDELTARPTYYGMLAFALAGRGRIVDLTLTTPPPATLRVYATREDSGTSWVVAINRDPAQAVTLSIQQPGSARRADIFRLLAPSLHSSTGLTLAGTSISPDGRWKPNTPEVAPFRDGHIEAAIPAAGAALIRLTG